MCKTLTTLIATNILLDFIIQAIIVERNLHAYYRIPTTTIKTCNDSNEFYILQCPLRTSINIPKPKDMPVCLIIGRHSENEDKQTKLPKAKQLVALNTLEDHHYVKPSKLVKIVQMKNGKPYTLLLKPIEKKEVIYKKTKIEAHKPYKNSLLKFMPFSGFKLPVNQTTVLYSIPLIQKLKMNDSLALSSTQEPQKFNQTHKSSVTPGADTQHGSLDEDDTHESPLKYLGVQDTLKKLQFIQKSPQSLATNQTQYKTEKFFANQDNYKKGFHTKGFQNMYHRDEIYNDHIFYDDLQQMGNYRIKQNLQQKQP